MLVVKNLPSNAGDARNVGLTPGSGRSFGVGNGNHSSILAWQFPWTEEPIRLPYMRLQRDGLDWATEHIHSVQSLSHVQLFAWVFIFLVLSCMNYFYILDINSLSVVSLTIIFSHSEDCPFTLFIVTFIVQNLLNLIQSSSVQFNRSVVSNSATPWTVVCQASLSITYSWSLLKLKSIKSVMPSNHLILWCPFFLLPSICSNISVFSNESVLHIVLEFQLQHQSFQWIFWTDFLYLIDLIKV